MLQVTVLISILVDGLWMTEGPLLPFWENASVLVGDAPSRLRFTPGFRRRVVPPFLGCDLGAGKGLL
jgi:hypothetical protein